MSLNERLKKYDNYVCHQLEKESNEVNEIDKNKKCNYYQEVYFLTSNIDNWEQYFNDYQIKILKLFLSYKNIADVANLLNKQYGSIYSAIFGTASKSQCGIFGKLKKIYSLKQGTPNKNVISQSVINRNNELNKSIHQRPNHKSLLLKYIDSIPNWEQYLTERQLEITKLFIIYKSYSKVDGITGTQSCWGILYGQSFVNCKGVFKRLQKQYYKLYNSYE